MLFRLMLVAFCLNGVCSFGLRILTGWDLAAEYTSAYLIFWYFAAASLVIIAGWRGFERIVLPEVLVGGALGLGSVCGQTALGSALSQGLPGNVVFPVTLAGGLFIVILAGIFLFRERLGKAGVLGVILGLMAIILLSFE